MSKGKWKKKNPNIEICSRCGQLEDLTVLRTKKLVDGFVRKHFICRPCNAEKKRIELKRNPVAARRADANSRARYPDKVKARYLARRHVPLQPCGVCGDKAQRHHEDYSKPLQVRFLCALHHKQLHLGVIA